MVSLRLYRVYDKFWLDQLVNVLTVGFRLFVHRTVPNPGLDQQRPPAARRAIKYCAD
jgi:hypothetical protein